MNKVRIKKAYEERKDALFWAFIWLGAVVGITGISIINNLRFSLGKTLLNNAIALAIVFFMLSYLSYRRGKL